ncbi:hypothetical protein BH09VER1_BH09VER1_38700 [soil metagenome]
MSLLCHRALCCLLALVLGSGMAGAAEAKRRTALVVGNAKYEGAVGTLRNTANDAKAVAQALRGLGFSVIERHDVTREQLLRAVDEFRKALPGSEVAVFYYAGHGISVDGANYLIPVKSGFDPEGADNVTLRMRAETRLFNAEQAVADMSSAGAGCNLVILDACRSAALARDTRNRGLSDRGGLVEMTPPAGSLIAFATDAGRAAFDGDGSNGLYTEELLKNLKTPGLTIEQVFKRTRAGVLQRSGGGQIPAEYSMLVGDDVYLAGRSASPIPAQAAAETPVAPAVPNPTQLNKLAATGNASECIKGLELRAQAQGPGEYAVEPLDTLLERVKNDLKQASGPSSKAVAALETCDLVLQALPECLPKEHARFAQLTSRAYNRKGDALLLLGRAQLAVAAFDAAVPLAPEDPYILYNRGRAHLALGSLEEARADFTEASAATFGQSNARKLAAAALARMK